MRTFTVLLLGLTIFACKKAKNTGDQANPSKLGYTGLRSVTQVGWYSQADTAWAAKITWQLQYTGKKLVSVAPDNFKQRLGTIYFTYDASDRPVAISQVGLMPGGDTASYQRFDIAYDLSGKLRSIVSFSSLGNNTTLNLFRYTNGLLTSIVRPNNGQIIVFDTALNIVNDAAGNIIGTRNVGGSGLDFTLSDKQNTLAGSTPVWLLQHFLEGSFERNNTPFYINRYLVASVIQSGSGATYFDNNYLFDGNGNVTRRVKVTPSYPPSVYDTVTYTYY